MFHWGLEGSGSILYRISRNGNDYFLELSSFVDKEDRDIWHQKKTKHISFEAFWQEATTNVNWYRWHPVFIHKDCKSIIMNSLEKVDLTGLTKEDHAIIDDWKRLL